jgi:hypothetical protein
MARPISTQKIIEIPCQGLIYRTPIAPPINTIRGSHLPKQDQVWYRDTTYLSFDWEIPQAQWTPEQQQWFDDEIERLHIGAWIMINGTPTYFNKYCYFFHQWFKVLQKVYPTYKETSLEYFYFYELCENDPFTLGDIGIKGRRVGLSSMSASIKLLIALLENNTLSGVVSKKGDDAYEMYLMVRTGLENLPIFLMPDLNKVTDSEIHIAKPTTKISKNNPKANSDKGKNNRINWLDTSENAYDGRPMRHVTGDEGAKWERYSIKVWLNKVSDALVTGAYILGHVSLFSTINRGDKGGNNFRDIWDGSNHVDGQKDKYGRTKTKLKRFFLPAFRGYMGYVGKYGESIIENPTKEQIKYLQTHEFYNPVSDKIGKCPDPFIGAKQWLEETRRMKENDPDDLAEEKRNNPFTWQETFQGSNNRCVIKNYDELIQQMQDVRAELAILGQKENGRRMRFEKRSDGEKHPVDDKTGMWHILELLKPGESNKSVYKFSIKCPNNGIFGSGGLDPVANTINPVDKGSDACLIIMKRYDALNPNSSYYPVAMYIGRPTTKRDFFEQCYWALEYYGIKMLGERAPTDWITYAEEQMLVSKEAGDQLYGYLVTTERANGSKTYGITPSGKDYKDQHATAIIEYAYFNMKKIRFIRILEDMLDFDVDNRTDYDACMALGYALIALQEWMPIQKVEVKAREFMKLKRSKTYY